jgi:hypothetical protein
LSNPVTAQTKIGQLLSEHPALLDSLVAYAPEFAKLRNPLMRKTFGRLASLADAARLANVETATLVEYINGLLAGGPTTATQPAPATVDPMPSDEAKPVSGKDINYRVDELTAMLRELHAGRTPEEVSARFGQLLTSVSAMEIAEAEQQLVADGLPEDEIKRLCDVHAAVFRGKPGQQVDLHLPLDHPLTGLRIENITIGAAVDRLATIWAELGDSPTQDALLARQAALATGLADLAKIEAHYVYVENRLFPVLERYGAEAPPKVMWAVHDDIRALLKQSNAALDAADPAALAALLPELLRTVSEMITKEEQVLFPLCMDLFEPGDWARLKAGADVDGAAAHAYRRPADRETAAGPVPTQGPAPAGEIELPVGLLAPEQLAMMLTTLPLDLTYVDEHDRVRFYSEGHRIFPRSPEIIGRKVQNCHPPKSMHVVQRIIDEMRAGTKDTADFWLELHGKFIYIRYLALRDSDANYRGVLEISQDITAIRQITGERRLLDW